MVRFTNSFCFFWGGGSYIELRYIVVMDCFGSSTRVNATMTVCRGQVGELIFKLVAFELACLEDAGLLCLRRQGGNDVS